MAMPWLRRWVTVLAGIVLALGLAAGLLYGWQVSGTEYLPIARAAMGFGGLGLGFLLGRALRPIGRWRPPVPMSAESAAPPVESSGRVWVRGLAAGFWMLAALEIAAALLFDWLVLPAALLAMLLPAMLAFGALLLIAVPLAIARGAVADGEGLPRRTLASAVAATWVGGLGLFLCTGVCAAFTGSLPSGAAIALDLGSLLTLSAVPAAAAGTPILVRRRPSLRGGAWNLLLALLTLGAAWLLYTCLGAWRLSLGPSSLLVWLLPGCLLWGGSAGAALVVTRAQRQGIAAARTDPRRVSPLALLVGGLGMFLLGLIPLGLWILFTLLPRPMAPAPPINYSMPSSTQPGGLPISGPALTYPAAGAVLTGPAQATPMPGPSTPVWTFTWRPPPGAAPGDAYQFTLWSPGAVMPVVQVVVPGTQLRISASAPLFSTPGALGPPGRPAAMPPAQRWRSGPWTWRVRLVRPGQGTGQWSEARPFTPQWIMGSRKTERKITISGGL